MINNYSPAPKWERLEVDIYRAVKRRGKYPSVATDTGVNSSFSYYIVKQCNSVAHYVFLDAWAGGILYKSCNLIGFENGQYSPIWLAHIRQYSNRCVYSRLVNT